MMKRIHHYKVVDVFSNKPLAGNPVAVVFDADRLSVETMQAIAGWTNLSETTFVLTPTIPAADYRLRIFTPRSELPFAGHPTLGSAHAVLEAGQARLRGDNRLVQQCNIGLVELTAEEGELNFALPSSRITPLATEDMAELEHIVGGKLWFGVIPALVNVGPVWLVLPMVDAAAVLALKPDFARLAAFERRLGITGLCAFGRHSPGGEADIEVRAFAPSCGVEEDPVCGSGNASVAAFRWEHGLLPVGGEAYVAAQGRCVGRNGRVKVLVGPEGKVRVGGACITCVDGRLAL
jgi:PhzF family phenazine biosynthesis protein